MIIPDITDVIVYLSINKPYEYITIIVRCDEMTNLLNYYSIPRVNSVYSYFQIAGK